MAVIIFGIILIGGAWYSCQKINLLKIDSFEECLKAGYSVLESLPRQCQTPDGRLFAEELKTCQDLCGDGICQEIVCQAIGCPCSEDKDSCPADCQ